MVNIQIYTKERSVIFEVRGVFKRNRPSTVEKMNAEEAKVLLKDRGVSVMNMPRGYAVAVSRRDGIPLAVSKWMRWMRS